MRRSLLFALGVPAIVAGAVTGGCVAAIADFDALVGEGDAAIDAPEGDGGSDASPFDAGANVDAGDPDLAGLVGWWRLDEGTGVVANDASGAGNHAALKNTPTWVTGYVGGALRFDGDEQFLESASLAGSAFPTSGTLSLWMTSAFAGTDPLPLFDGNREDGGPHLFLRQNGAGKLQFAGRANGPAYTFNSVFDVPANRWTHLVVTWDAVSLLAGVYVDGVASASVPITAGWSPSAQIVRFARREAFGAFVGSLDEIRLYARVLPPDAIARLR